MKKLFNLNEVAPLLVAKGRYGCEGGEDSDGKPFPTRLKHVDFDDDCSGDDDANSTFTLTFMDPHDDRCYQAQCSYDKDASDGRWLSLKDKEGNDADPDEYPHGIRRRGVLEDDQIECTCVEKKRVTVEQWVEA